MEAYSELIRYLAGAGSPIRVELNTPREIRLWLIERFGADDEALLDELTEFFEALFFGGDEQVTPEKHEHALTLMARLRSAPPPAQPEESA